MANLKLHSAKFARAESGAIQAHAGENPVLAPLIIMLGFAIVGFSAGLLATLVGLGMAGIFLLGNFGKEAMGIGWTIKFARTRMNGTSLGNATRPSRG